VLKFFLFGFLHEIYVFLNLFFFIEPERATSQREQRRGKTLQEVSGATEHLQVLCFCPPGIVPENHCQHFVWLALCLDSGRIAEFTFKNYV